MENPRGALNRQYDEMRYIQAIICPSHLPRRRETAGDPYIKSDRGGMRSNTGPRYRSGQLRRLQRVGRMGYDVERNSGLTWTTKC